MAGRRSAGRSGGEGFSDREQGGLFAAAQDGPSRGPAPHYHDHRARLRQRFLSAGADSVSDYEMLELLLFRAIPRRDVKPLAKNLLARFGDFNAVISAPAAPSRTTATSTSSRSTPPPTGS